MGFFELSGYSLELDNDGINSSFVSSSSITTPTPMSFSYRCQGPTKVVVSSAHRWQLSSKFLNYVDMLAGLRGIVSPSLTYKDDYLLEGTIPVNAIPHKDKRNNFRRRASLFVVICH